MKEKRYLCDLIENKLKKICGNDSKFNFIMVISIVVILLLSSVITLPFVISSYKDELNKLSESDYKCLEEVASSFYDKESKTVNLSNIPDNVTISNLDFNDSELSFKCTLNKEFIVTSNPNISVTVTDNFENVKIVRNSSNRSILFLFIRSCLPGLLFLFIISLALLVFCIILLIITLIQFVIYTYMDKKGSTSK